MGDYCKLPRTEVVATLHPDSSSSLRAPTKWPIAIIFFTTIALLQSQLETTQPPLDVTKQLAPKDVAIDQLSQRLATRGRQLKALQFKCKMSLENHKVDLKAANIMTWNHDYVAAHDTNGGQGFWGDQIVLQCTNSHQWTTSNFPRIRNCTPAHLYVLRPWQHTMIKSMLSMGSLKNVCCLHPQNRKQWPNVLFSSERNCMKWKLNAFNLTTIIPIMKTTHSIPAWSSHSLLAYTQIYPRIFFLNVNNDVECLICNRQMARTMFDVHQH